jgi:hypothetical protein
MSEEHVQPDQLFALMWANRDNAPPKEGEGADAELARMFSVDMDERFEKPLRPEQQLGPQTATRLWEHALTCPTCRMLILEDGPGSRPPRTKAEIQKEVVDKDAQRRSQKIKFFTNITVGTAAFMGAFWCMQTINNKNLTGPEGAQLVGIGPKEIDPLWYAFVVLILIASWFLAEAYVLAKDLWLDFTAWKRAVPVIGKRWAERDKRREQEERRGGPPPPPKKDSS